MGDGDATQDDGGADDEVWRYGFGEDDEAGSDGDDGEQVADGGAFVLVEPVVEDVGESGAEDAEDEHVADDWAGEVRWLQAGRRHDECDEHAGGK